MPPRRRPEPTAPEASPAPGLVRRLAARDARAYRQLMLAAYRRHPDAFTSTSAERGALPLAWWEERLSSARDAPTCVWGVFFGRQLAGVVGLEFNGRTKTRHKATVFGMFVPSKFRRRGLGRRLLAAALTHAREHGAIRQLQLTVTDNNTAACRLYEQSGFRRWGAEPDAVRWRGRSFTKLHYARAIESPATR